MRKVHRYEFDEVAQMLLGRSIDVCKTLLPGGRMQGHEYVVGDLSGRSGKSLSINTRTGVWTDFAGDPGGGDLISLWAAVQGTGQGDAKANAEAWLGLTDTRPAAVPVAAPARAQAVPVETSGKVDPYWWKSVKPTKVWNYRTDQGLFFGDVYRFDHPTEKKNGKSLKTIRPWNGSDWLAPPGVRPLYRLPELLQHDGPVVVVEGEKTADAIVRVGWCGTTCWGGVAGVAYADWSPLAGRDVILWPDADPPSAKKGKQNAAEQWLLLLREALSVVGVASIRMVE